MDKLTEEIYQSLLKHEGIADVVDGNPISSGICEAHAKAAAEVAKQWIEKAFHSAYTSGVFDCDTAHKTGNFNNIGSMPKLATWQKENEV